MGITLPGLLHADTGQVREVAARWERLADDLDATVEDLVRGTRDLPHHWTGDGAQAAQERGRKLQITVGNAQPHCAAIAAALRDLAARLDHYRQMAYDVVAEAERNRLRVDLSTGEVTTTWFPSSADIASAQTLVDDAALRLQYLVSQADDADHQAVAVLVANRISWYDKPDDELPDVDPMFLILDSAPEFKAQVWHDLHQLNRDRLVTEHPELVGPALGLPTDVRDRANRLLLARAKAELLARRERLDTIQDGAASRATMNADAGLAGITAVERELAATPGARLLNYPPAVLGTADPTWDDFVPPTRVGTS